MKLIATIGPSSKEATMVDKLISNGANCIRLNFSHFNEQQFEKIIENVRKINKDILIMADLCGSKVRVHENIKRVFSIKKNDTVYFCSYELYEVINNINAVGNVIPLNLTSQILRKTNMDNISMKDGTIRFKVIGNKNGIYEAKVLNDGVVRGGKGFNIPNLDRTNFKLSENDKTHIDWAIEKGVDIICQSFVSNSNDIIEVKEYIAKGWGTNKQIKYIGKVETKTGLLNCEKILEECDGILIGRGDLLPETGILNAVEYQFEAINRLRPLLKGKDLIIGTHILGKEFKIDHGNLSNIESIFTFIKSGVTGFLLASETSINDKPELSVAVLKEIITRYASGN